MSRRRKPVAPPPAPLSVPVVDSAARDLEHLARIGAKVIERFPEEVAQEIIVYSTRAMLEEMTLHSRSNVVSFDAWRRKRGLLPRQAEAKR